MYMYLWHNKCVEKIYLEFKLTWFGLANDPIYRFLNNRENRNKLQTVHHTCIKISKIIE